MLDFINDILRYVFINISILYVSTRIIGYKKVKLKTNKLILSILSCIIIAFIYTILITSFSSLFTLLALCILLTFVISYLSDNKFDYSLIVTSISEVITLSFYTFSVFISSMILKSSIININDNNPIILILAILLSCLIIYKFFSIKRFKYRIFFSAK